MSDQEVFSGPEAPTLGRIRLLGICGATPLVLIHGVYLWLRPWSYLPEPVLEHEAELAKCNTSGCPKSFATLASLLEFVEEGINKDKDSGDEEIKTTALTRRLSRAVMGYKNRVDEILRAASDDDLDVAQKYFFVDVHKRSFGHRNEIFDELSDDILAEKGYRKMFYRFDKERDLHKGTMCNFCSGPCDMGPQHEKAVRLAEMASTSGRTPADVGEMPRRALEREIVSLRRMLGATFVLDRGGPPQVQALVQQRNWIALPPSKALGWSATAADGSCSARQTEQGVIVMAVFEDGTARSQTLDGWPEALNTIEASDPRDWPLVNDEDDEG